MNSRPVVVSLVALSLAMACQSAPKPKPPVASAGPFYWPVPAGWKAETIKFPLEFAKDLPLEGVEELRFAPGMFKPAEAGYWSYAFAWWLDNKPSLSEEELQGLLHVYFAGLTESVGAEKKVKFNPSQFSASTHRLPGSELKANHQVDTYEGTADLYDAFGDGRAISLNLNIWVWDCPDSGKRVAMVLASPKPAEDPIWEKLAERRTEMRCHNE